MKSVYSTQYICLYSNSTTWRENEGILSAQLHLSHRLIPVSTPWLSLFLPHRYQGDALVSTNSALVYIILSQNTHLRSPSRLDRAPQHMLHNLLVYVDLVHLGDFRYIVP